MKQDTFYLYWNIHTLLGSENDKSAEAIDAIVRGIDAEDDFPPVRVFRDKNDSNKFYLYNGITSVREMESDGGHCRAIGHYIANKPLKCILVKNNVKMSDYVWTEISNMILTSNVSSYLWRKQKYPNYR